MVEEYSQWKLIEEFKKTYKQEYSKISKKVDFYKSFLLDLINLLNLIQQKKDAYIGNHSKNVSNVSLKIAEKLNQTLEKKIDLEFLNYGALLHDFGKIFLPETILNKPSLLNDVEKEMMKLHTTIAYDVFKNSFLLTSMKDAKIIGDIILYHHESYDGKGYPKSLRGERIPLVARIVKIADVYDALISERSYRSAFSKEQAIEIIKSEKEKFDPKILEIFLDIIK
ncbi:MAG: HD domain-containing protein [Candidatus Woesearchaeota archaeon]